MGARDWSTVYFGGDGFTKMAVNITCSNVSSAKGQVWLRAERVWKAHTEIFEQIHEPKVNTHISPKGISGGIHEIKVERPLCTAPTQKKCAKHGPTPLLLRGKEVGFNAPQLFLVLLTSSDNKNLHRHPRKRVQCKWEKWEKIPNGFRQMHTQKVNFLLKTQHVSFAPKISVGFCGKPR